MHWVLQMALDPHPGPDNPCAALQPYLELDDEAMAALAGLLVDEYAKRFLPEDTARFAYLLSRLKKSMTGLLCYLRDEQNQSRFRPVACELKNRQRGRRRARAAVPPVRRAHGAARRYGGPRRRVGRRRRHPLGAGGGLQDRQQKAGLERSLLRAGLPDAAVSVQPDPRPQRALYRRTAGGRVVSAGRPRPGDPAPRTGCPRVEYQLDGLVRDEQKIFDAMDADETGKYLPFGYRNGAPSPYQKDKRADSAKLSRIQLHLDDLVTQMGEQLYGGQIDAEPLVVSSSKSPCTWCDYSFICCHETGVHERALEAPAKPFEPEEEPEEEEEQP